MQSFKQYHQNLHEARSRGEAMEEVIIAAVNGNPQSDSKYKIDADAGVKVAEFLKKNGISGKGQVLGADTIEVTEKWSQFWDGSVPAATKTPKTDFIIGSAKISLKAGDASQLMSGARNESLATFYAAFDKTKDDISDEIGDKLKNMFENLAGSGVASGKLKKVIKDKSDEIVNKANAAHKEIMNDLESIFKTNTDFRDAFAYEAMSGEQKFGGNLGTCTHFLVTGFDGGSTKLHSVQDRSYISYIANQMKVSVRFKTTSVKRVVNGKQTKTGEYRYWSVVGLIIDKMNEDVEQLLNSGKMLTENIITDFFKGVWARIKSALDAAIQYIKGGVKNIINFLEIVPEIKFDNKIRF